MIANSKGQKLERINYDISLPCGKKRTRSDKKRTNVAK